MEIFDFSNAEYSNRNGSYGGAAGDKDGILINGESWIAKYPKSNDGMAKSDKLSKFSQTPLSEFIGSHSVQEPFTIDGEHHLNYRSILDLTESEIPAAQVENLWKHLTVPTALPTPSKNSLSL